MTKIIRMRRQQAYVLTLHRSQLFITMNIGRATFSYELDFKPKKMTLENFH